MSDAELQRLQVTNPNLYHAVQNGTLPEANHDFVTVANRYPQQHEKQ